MYVELYGPHFVRAFSQKNYEVTARARVVTRPFSLNSLPIGHASIDFERLD